MTDIFYDQVKEPLLEAIGVYGNYAVLLFCNHGRFW